MSDRLPMEYDIRKVRDFLMVPPERREICLSEFGEWLEIMEQITSIMPLAVTGKTDVFHWIDDDKGEMRVRAEIHESAKTGQEMLGAHRPTSRPTTGRATAEDQRG